MNKSSILPALLVASLGVGPVYALEEMDDEVLSDSSAQDGISLGIILPTYGWRASALELHDSTGIPTTIKPGFEFNRGDLRIRDFALRTCYEASINGNCTSSGLKPQGIRLDIDMIGNAGLGSPMLNLRGTLLGTAAKLRVYMDKITIRNGLGGNESTLIDFNHQDAAYSNKDYVDLLPSTSTLFDLQLGSESTGHMISFGTTSFARIDFGEVRLVDKTDTGIAGNGRNLRFNLTLDNLVLTGAGMDLGPTGLVISTPNLTNMNVTLGNITAGSSGVSMGTVGIKGLNLSNHMLTISGKS